MTGSVELPARADLPAGVARNADVAWAHWPVERYLAENYRQLHPADVAVIDHHSAYYRRLAPGSVARSLEFGAGPNLYPLMLAAACSREIHAVDPSPANTAYLDRQLAEGPEDFWRPVYAYCRRQHDALPPDLGDVLARVRVFRQDGLTVTPGHYGLASMHFVAEAATEDHAEFRQFCLAFVRSVHPGGHLVAAFVENQGRYRIGDGPEWPSYPVDADGLRAAFQAHTTELEITRIDRDPTLPEFVHTGMLLLTARRREER